MNKYTIITTWYKYGSKAIQVNAENVRTACENEKKMQSVKCIFNDSPTYVRIEVVNNETGEIREYWNNKENKILF